MAIKACIFDLEGVLVYVNKFHFIAWKRIAKSMDIEFTTDMHKQFRGLRREQCLDKMLEWGKKALSDEEKTRLLEKKSRYFTDGLSTLGPDKVFPGALDFLKTLQQEGIKIALSGVGYHVKKILRLIGLTHYFDSIVDGKDFSFSRFDKELFLENANTFGLQPNECLVFEASNEGLQTAKAIGMHTVGIGLESEFQFADKTILSFEKIGLEFLEEFN